ncbi:MAG: toll/interleukin-1 receptor domain-containing protein [Rickettsiaceae bacterium]
MGSYVIPRKINHYRQQLKLIYKNTKQPILEDIIGTSPIYVRTCYAGGPYGPIGHDWTLYLNKELYCKLGGFNKINKIRQTIQSDLTKLSAGVNNECINNVFIELFNPEDDECKKAINPKGIASLNDDNSTLYLPGHLKLFISHRHKYQELVSELSESLRPYGISCFIAQKDIEPTEEWRNEIEKALRSMDVFLAFLTEDFSGGDWTNQEVGFAVARGVHIIPVKVSSKDPYGFMSIYQALSGDPNNMIQLATDIFNLISHKFDKKNIVKQFVIDAFINSSSFSEANRAFNILQTYKDFTDIELENIINGFNANDQLYQCDFINNKNQFFNFIQSRSTKNYQVKNKKIILINDDEISF